LNKKHKIFADAYLEIDRKGRRVRNQTEAYMAAYPSVKRSTAMANSYKLLSNAQIKAYVEKIERQRLERTNITAERVLKEYAKCAFVNMDDMLDEHGRLKPKSELERADLAAVASITVKETYIGGGKEDGAEPDQVVTTNIKLLKQHSLDALSKYLGLFEKDNKQKEPKVQFEMNFGPSPDDDGDDEEDSEA
jgi:phage terminase small subunit